jgi:alginate O-acetyltransferase complex protein AlgJ
VTTETVAETVSEQRRTDVARRRVPRVRRPLIALLALLFFFGPAFAFLLGARPQQIENRKLTEFPSISDGWKFFPEFTAWATDHLPLRAQAVRANTTVSEKVFKEPPSYGSDSGGTVGVAGIPAGPSSGSSTKDVVYPKVIQGNDGWLYFGADVSGLCSPARSVADTMDRLHRLADAVTASGRTFVLAVAPDKSDVAPQHLPANYAGKDCVAKRRAAFWKALADDPPAGYLDVRSSILAEQKRIGATVYRPNDTHWGPRGAAVYAQELARRLDPSLGQGTHVIQGGTVSENGDLAPMIGERRTDTVPKVVIQRDGVSPVGRATLDFPEMPYSPQTFTDASTAAPLFTPRTLILGDSFTSASGAMLGPYFAHATLLHEEASGPYAQAVAKLMVDNDVVVVEIVERTIAGGGGAIISDTALSAITPALAANHR